MATYRHHLPQIDGGLFLTDAGIETTLIFLDGLDLAHFAAFDLLKDDAGTEALRRYFRRHAKIARDNGTGFPIESATWRASLGQGVRRVAKPFAPIEAGAPGRSAAENARDAPPRGSCRRRR